MFYEINCFEYNELRQALKGARILMKGGTNHIGKKGVKAERMHIYEVENIII